MFIITLLVSKRNKLMLVNACPWTKMDNSTVIHINNIVYILETTVNEKILKIYSVKREAECLLYILIHAKKERIFLHEY